MKTEKLSERTCLVEMPIELSNPDEKPYLDACVFEDVTRNNNLLLDFSKVKRINGLGISMLVKLSTLSSKRKQKILAFGINNHYLEVFNMTGLDRAIKLCRDVTEAHQIAGIAGYQNIRSEEPVTPDDSQDWAPPVEKLITPAFPSNAINMNMKGRRVVGPVDGFGALWQKKYLLPVNKEGISPGWIIEVLKREFTRFQPPYNRFYPSERGIAPGEVIAIDSSTPGGPVSTGVMVLHADNEAFTFITPQGHPESGWVTFSVVSPGGNLAVQILGLARANDPIYEIAFRAIGSEMQIRIWRHVLESLARDIGVPAEVSVEAKCIDPRLRWSQSGNLWYNAQARTILASPVWWITKKLAARNGPPKV